jgi:5-methylcytosine-specific restriction protein A
MARRKEFTRKIKKAALDRANGHCERCQAVLKTGEAEFDHILPCEFGGEPTLANCQCICKACHREKTKIDVRAIRKSDRARDKASGAVKPKGRLANRGFEKKERREKLPVPQPRRMFR